MKYLDNFSGRTLPVLISLVFVFLLTTCKTEESREYGWFDFVVADLDSMDNPVNMSFLNEGLAGESGHVTISNGHFVDGNGNRIRFFGDNLTFSDCFPEKEVATQLAAALKKRGMNVIRFHHMDMQSAPRGIWNEARDGFDPGQVDKLDWLVYQLKKNGIYTNLNTHVSYTYEGADYEEARAFNFGKGIDNFYRPYIDFQKNYAKMLLTHENVYTGNTYAEEPAVAFVEVNNENSIISRWQALANLKPEHRSALLQQWKAWLKGNPEHSRAAGKDLVWIIENFEEVGDAQKGMLWAFLVDAELEYAREMIDYFKDDLGVQALISESQASYSGVAGVYREAEYSDFIDMHAYWEHPRWSGRPWSSSDWTIRNSSMVTDKEAGTLSRFGQHGVAGFPLTISEYDHPAPSFFSAEMYPMLNAVAAFQDWDGIYHFDFGGNYNQGKINSYFSTAGHPLKQIFIPVGAILFRMETIQPAQKTVALGIPPESVVDLMVKYGYRMDDIWEAAGAPSGLVLLHKMHVDMKAGEFKLSEEVSQPEGAWTSDTGELTWDNTDSTQAVFTINAPAAKGAVGYIGGKEIDLDKVTIAMDTIPGNWGTITLTALDGKPVEESSRILLVAAGRVENTGMGWNEQYTSVNDQWGTAPTRAEGIPARIILRDMDRFTVHTLDSTGSPEAELEVNRRGGEQTIGIGAQYKTLWYLLTRE